MRRPAVLLLAPVLVLGLAVGCGDDDPDATATDGTTVPAESTGDDDGTDGSTASSAPGDTEPPSDEGSTTTGDDGASTTAPDTTDPADLPGEAIEIYPYEGASMAVVGVEVGDTLNVRSGPGADFDVVTELDPLDHGFTATGSNRQLDDDSVWAGVTTDDGTGWANVGFLAQLGDTRSITGEVVVTDEEAAPVDIARDIALQRAGEGEGPTPTVTVAKEGGGVAIVDVLGFADDAQRGERIQVAVAGGSVTVLSTALCARGVSAGLCA